MNSSSCFYLAFIITCLKSKTNITVSQNIWKRVTSNSTTKLLIFGYIFLIQIYFFILINYLIFLLKNFFKLFLLFFTFWPHYVACEIIASWPWIKPMPPAYK